MKVPPVDPPTHDMWGAGGAGPGLPMTPPGPMEEDDIRAMQREVAEHLTAAQASLDKLADRIPPRTERQRQLTTQMAIYREHPYAVEFYNPGTRMTVWSGWSCWADAMARCAHYTRKYGQFDGFEKPRIKATGA